MTYLCGLTWADTPKANPRPFSAREVIDLAAADGLSWVEMPPRMFDGTDAKELALLRGYAENRGIQFVIPGGRVSVADLTQHLEIAHQLGAPTVRCTLSGVLCGDRRRFPGGWRAHLDHCENEIAGVLGLAERLKIAIALENHQDADSDDLLRLCGRFENRYLGITLDCGNPLAVMEEPVAFAAKVAPYLRHAHLKDYRVYRVENGFRLVRCALGEGVVDFEALFGIFDAQEWRITRNIEIGALQARQIPILEASWWDEFAPRDARDLLKPLNIVWNRCRPEHEEWRTPFELDEPGAALGAYEMRQYEISLRNLRGLVAQEI